MRSTPNNRSLSLPRKMLARLGVLVGEATLRYMMRGKVWWSRDVEIRVRMVRGDPEFYAQRVANALSLIARYDPARLRRIQRDVRAVIVSPFVLPGAVAQYNQRYAVCLLDSTYVRDTPAALVALSIVHEATHARLALIAVTEANINRIERICASQEVAFASRLPGFERVESFFQEAVERTLETDYSKAGVASRGLDALRASGMSPAGLAALEKLAAYMTDRAGPAGSEPGITKPPPNER